MNKVNNSAKILLVEDDPGMGFVIQDTLKEQGYTVHLCRDGKAGLLQFNRQEYDLCLLDVMMPKKDGFELAGDIRKLNPEVPLIFVTAKGMVNDRVEGLKIGADDYITKPFSKEELLLRVEAVLRRTRKEGSTDEKMTGFTFGMFVFDPDNFLLQHPGNRHTLTRKEAGILKLLCEHMNKVIERELITNVIWGDDSYFVGRSLDVFITRLRKYLSVDPAVNITNVHGVGFKLEVLESQQTN